MEFDFFIKADLQAIFTKILTDCIERTQGIPDKILPTLWDNCLANEASKGLVSLVAGAMVNKSELYLIYNSDIIRKADTAEATQIKIDYQLKGESSLGIFISFQNYTKTDMLKIYSEMEYSLLNALNKNLNVSKSIQFKYSKLRESIGVNDRNDAISQAQSMATALGKGNNILMDKEDVLDFAAVNMDPTEKAMLFLDSKRAFYLGLPISYINGEQTPGIGSTGEADTKAVERGLKNYFISIIKPVLKALYGINTMFKSHDFRQIDSALEAIKTFELTGTDFLSNEDKAQIVKNLFDIEQENQS